MYETLMAVIMSLIVFSFFGYLFISKKSGGLWAVVGSFIGCAGVYYVVKIALPRFINYFSKTIEKAQVLGPSDIVAGVMVISLITVIYVAAKIKYSEKRIVDLFYWPTLALLVAPLLNGSVGLITTVQVFMGIAILALFYLTVRNWGGFGRVAFAVMITYGINIVVTATLLYVLGFRRGFILAEAHYFLALILLLQVIFFWLSIGLDPQERDLKKRKSYWINKIWMYGCVFAIILFAKSFIVGDLVEEDLFLAGDKNFAKEAEFKLELNEAMKEYDRVTEKIKAAFNNNDKAEVIRLKKMAEEHQARLEVIKARKEKADFIIVDTVIDGAKSDLGRLKDKIKSYLPEMEKPVKQHYHPRASNVRIYHPGTHVIHLDAGQTTDHWIMFSKTKNYFKAESSDNRFILILDDGSAYNAWESKSVGHRDRLKFKIKAVTPQKIIMGVS